MYKNGNAAEQRPDIKAVFFDLDGTLFSMSTRSVPPSAMEALRALRAKGVKIVAATGRPVASMAFLDDIVEFDAYITANGQYCYTKEGLVHCGTFARQEIEGLLALLEEESFPCLFFGKDEYYVNYMDELVMEHFRRTSQALPEVRGPENAPNEDIYQVIVYMDEEREQKLRERLRGFKMARSVWLCIDMMPLDGGKQVGMRAVLEHFGLGMENAMAFGDGFNDVDMLAAAHVGVAMGNAPEGVKQQADYVTADVDEDGVYRALERFGVI